MEIWRFDIPLEMGESGGFSLEMPEGAIVLTAMVKINHVAFAFVGSQIVHTPSIWAFVDPDVEKEQRHFTTIGTGHEIYGTVSVRGKPYAPPVDLEYITSYQYGLNIWHLFERK